MVSIAVAGAHGPCPSHNHKPLPKGTMGITDRGLNCPDCRPPKGPAIGRVYALDPSGTIGVRKDCWDCEGKGTIQQLARDPDGRRAIDAHGNTYLVDAKCDGDPDEGCDGRGWVPTTDAWVLLEAIIKAGWGWTIAWNHHFGFWRSGGPRFDYIENGESLKGDFLQALSKVLVAQGYTLGGE